MVVVFAGSYNLEMGMPLSKNYELRNNCMELNSNIVLIAWSIGDLDEVGFIFIVEFV